jgi:hypothetical protein
VCDHIWKRAGVAVVQCRLGLLNARHHLVEELLDVVHRTSSVMFGRRQAGGAVGLVALRYLERRHPGSKRTLLAAEIEVGRVGKEDRPVQSVRRATVVGNDR